MDQHRVFVSSTIEDLAAERQAVDRVLTSLGFFEVIRVEQLPSANRPSEAVCLREVARAEAVFLIIGSRYGWVPPHNNPQGLSVTHIEYQEARRLGRRVYVFVRATVSRDERAAAFVEEVSDYHEGYFRRTWSTVEDLAQEVRRSALNWLASDFRTAGAEERPDSLADQLGQFPLTTPSVELEVEGAAAWLATFLSELEALCHSTYLPTPSLGATSDSTFGLKVQTSTQDGGVRVTSTLSPTAAAQEPSISIQLAVALTPADAHLAARTASALVRAGADDTQGSIATLLELAASITHSPANRETLVACAANISAASNGAASPRVVEAMMDLPSLKPATVNWGILALLAAQLRYAAAGATQALRDTERLAAKLLLTALSQPEPKPEMLYNLGHQVLGRAPDLCKQLLQQLLEVDPSYEERWYYHRDLGVIDYQAGRYADAARHYDRAVSLKETDSELRRQAGDARYYNGEWAEALLRYERAVSLDSIEEYFLDAKIEYCKTRIAAGVAVERAFAARSRRTQRLAALGVGLAEADRARPAGALFRLAVRMCDLSFDSNRWLALYSNRAGGYGEAANYLRTALASIPEDPWVRLNLIANLIFQHGGAFGPESSAHARIALFHGGPAVLERFAVQMINTPTRDSLVDEMTGLLRVATEERTRWLERRAAVQAPERHGTVTHIEIR